MLGLEGDLNLLASDDRIGRRLQDLTLEPSPGAKRRKVTTSPIQNRAFTANGTGSRTLAPSPDPDLSPDELPFFPKPELGNFGIFLDSSPDRWGQTLMKRREALQTRDEKRLPRTLYAWDFLIGAQDQTRQGALRFRPPGTATFLGDEKMGGSTSDDVARTGSGGV